MAPIDLGWLNAAIETARSAWVAFVAPAAIGLFSVYQFRALLKERSAKSKRDQQSEEAETLAKLRASLDDEMKERFDRIVAENQSKDAEIKRLNGVVWSWYELAHQIWHDWAHVLTVANIRLEKISGAIPVDESMFPRKLSRNIDNPVLLEPTPKGV